MTDSVASTAQYGRQVWRSMAYLGIAMVLLLMALACVGLVLWRAVKAGGFTWGVTWNFVAATTLSGCGKLALYESEMAWPTRGAP